MTKRKSAGSSYRVAANHSVALEGGRMAGPGAIVNFPDGLSDHDQQLVDDGHLAEFEGDTGGGDEVPKIPDVSETEAPAE